jgi:hypothetical protein
MFRWPVRCSLAIVTLLLVGCGLRPASGNLPTPVPTSDVKPTFPPTYTASPTETPILTPTATLTLSPTVTLTLTLTPQPIPTSTPTLPPSATPTWTPDLSTVTPGGPGSAVDVGTPVAGRTAAPGCTGTTTGGNLLLNPGFEEGFYFQDGSPSLAVPEGWTGFWLPEGSVVEYDLENQDGYRQPEMQVILAGPPFDIPPRVRTGEQAYYLFGGNKVFDGGIWQQVTVMPDDLLCLTGYAHAWSSHKAGDPAQSLLETEDDRRNANFLLGIDPLGGTSPWASGVVWSTPGHLYDEYQPVPSVQVRAGSGTVTVFVRGFTMWRFDHNDLFFDDISLVTVAP